MAGITICEVSIAQEIEKVIPYIGIYVGLFDLLLIKTGRLLSFRCRMHVFVRHFLTGCDRCKIYLSRL